MREFLQSTARNLSVWLASSSDHITGATGQGVALAAALQHSKNGGAPATLTVTVTEIGHGWYNLALTTTTTNTLGDLVIYATVSGCDPLDVRGEVIAVSFADAVRLGLTALPNVASGSAGAIPTTGTGANQINVDGAGNASANVAKWLGTAAATPTTAGVPSIDVITWKGGTVPATSITGVPKVDVAAFLGTAAATPTVAGIPKTEASGGSITSVSGAVGSVTGNVGGNVTGSVGSIASGGISSFSFAAGAIGATAFTNNVNIQVVTTGTAGAVGASSITLAGAVATLDYYKGCRVFILSATTGAGQERLITTNTASASAVCTLDRAWAVTPTGTVVYQILPADDAYLTSLDTAASGIAAAVWDVPRASHTTAGTFGEYVLSSVQKWLGTTVNSLVSGRVDADVGNMQAGTITSSTFAANAINAAALATDAATEVATSVWSTVLEGSYTAANLARLWTGVLAGKLTGVSTSAPVFKSLDATKTRVSGTISSDGRPTATIGDLS